ncbi:hypothetical protein BDP81DRAFT_159778 [Colletotrichum phormii]|uniref:Uncharacterized protein n=1 Tax=Colletotrichum phormii TaxID=359342 RepID=A0AAI9ZXT5_9PEZI|nr:uncharacterized protein BDP81DRAFT_159778 [Colletotrichum phormii]KAK1640205.1 hypothetical protein BDP81DRAFT_159778 [Colletotrichum phormii]
MEHLIFAQIWYLWCESACYVVSLVNRGWRHLGAVIIKRSARILLIRFYHLSYRITDTFRVLSALPPVVAVAGLAEKMEMVRNPASDDNLLRVLCAAIGRPKAPRSPRSPEDAPRGAMQLRAVTSSAPSPTCDRSHAIEAILVPIWTFCRPKSF